jgi:hypothetical protein
MAIRRRVDDGFKSNVTASSRAILDNDWLAESIGKRLCHQAGDGVVCPSGSDPDDQTNRLCRIIERKRRLRDNAGDGSRRGEAQENARDNAGYDSHEFLHQVPPAPTKRQHQL